MWLRALLAVPVLAGCSLIYNPNDLPLRVDASPPDAPPDAEIILDADPSALALERVVPAVIVEGTGAAGGRPAVITVIGMQIVDGAKISLTRHDGMPLTGITVDDARTERADDGFIVAAPISIDVLPELAAGQSVRLDVTVTQLGSDGEPVTETLTEIGDDGPVLELRGLDELTTPGTLSTSAPHEFSEVNVEGDVGAADNAKPLIIRARAGITITGTVDVSASGTNPGPGGGGGGPGGSSLLDDKTGQPGAGTGGGRPSGGGGGFGTAGTAGATTNSGGMVAGNPALPTLADPNHGSGGAGGNGATLGNGGDGGGGGGTVELTGGGAVSVGTILAKGGQGAAAGANDGGGGSGGAILLRGSEVTVTTFDVTGGTSDGDGGKGGLGRVRIDVPGTPIPPSAPQAVTYRGPTFKDPPLITREPTPMVTVVGEGLAPFQYLVLGESGEVSGPFSKVIGATNTVSFRLAEPLNRGFNRLCTVVDGGNPQQAEAIDCVDLVFLLEADQ